MGITLFIVVVIQKRHFTSLSLVFSKISLIRQVYVQYFPRSISCVFPSYKEKHFDGLRDIFINHTHDLSSFQMLVLLKDEHLSILYPWPLTMSCIYSFPPHSRDSTVGAHFCPGAFFKALVSGSTSVSHINSSNTRHLWKLK